jgi:hypothetical protein
MLSPIAAWENPDSVGGGHRRLQNGSSFDKGDLTFFAVFKNYHQVSENKHKNCF